jgi:two-component system, LytTR family, response regulator
VSVAARPVVANGTTSLDVLAVDDEAPALDDLARLLRSFPEVGEVESAASGPEALRRLSGRRFDAVFLDVRMPGLDGLELARVLRRFGAPPAVVFVSAYETGAVGAFELKALDYLMKPVSRQRMAEAIGRVVEALEVQPGELPRGEGGEADEVVAVSTARGGTRLLPRAAVLYLEAQGDYVRIVADEGRFLVRGRISELERSWRTSGFMRVHRGYVANLRRAEEIRPRPGGTAVLAFPGGLEIPVARRKAAALRRRLGG